jgi:hypothetical protein
MTLVLAAAVGDSAIVCADSRVFVQDHPGAPVRAGRPETKLSLKWGCAIGTYGASPRGVHVHTAIAALPGPAETPDAVARAVLERFTRGEVVPRMGAFVAGAQDGAGLLYRVEVEPNIIRRELPEVGMAPQIHPGGRPIPAGLAVEVAETAEATLERMLAIQRAVAGLTDTVGPPFEYVIIRFNQQPVQGRADV